ncbi:MAG TPA: hypothetical protein VHZ30_04650, partial [Verrucomicrobiae bacterium]|nr:hypothetical protein [Verrucomicrobiae bacterium]
GSDETIFFIEGYPYEAEENQYIQTIAAKESGVYTYTTVLGGTSTIRRFVYGRVCSAPVAPPPSVEQLQAQALAAKQKKEEAAAKGLKYDRDLANAGDGYGELRMGERYRDGDGVPKDSELARSWFAKAAAQGEPNAAKELAALQ